MDLFDADFPQGFGSGEEAYSELMRSTYQWIMVYVDPESNNTYWEFL